jgi:hypothetical protein
MVHVPVHGLVTLPRWPLSEATPLAVDGPEVEIVMVPSTTYDVSRHKGPDRAMATSPTLSAIEALEEFRGGRLVRRPAPNVYIFFGKRTERGK